MDACVMGAASVIINELAPILLFVRLNFKHYPVVWQNRDKFIRKFLFQAIFLLFQEACLIDRLEQLRSSFNSEN